MHIHSSYNSVPRDINLYYHDCNCLVLNSFICQCQKIKCVNEIKYLGMTVDNNLRWDLHINKLYNKLCYSLMRLENIKYLLPFNIRRILYFSMIESLIRYGIEIWGLTYNCHIDKINRIQRKALRFIMYGSVCTNTGKSVSNINMYKTCNVLSPKYMAYMNILR